MPLRRANLKRARKNRPFKRVLRTVRRYNARRYAKKYGSLYAERKWGCIQFGSTGTAGEITTGETCSAQGLNLGAPVQSCFGSDLYDVPFAMRFNISFLNQYLEFTQLFDAYKLLGATIKLQTTLSTGTQPSTPVPYIEYIADYDSGTAPSIPEFNQKMGIKTKYFTSSRPAITMTVRPKPNPVLYNTGGLIGALGWGRKSYWIDCTQPNVDHFGIVGVIRNVWLPNGPSQQSLFTLDCHQKLMLRDVQ